MSKLILQINNKHIPDYDTLMANIRRRCNDTRSTDFLKYGKIYDIYIEWCVKLLPNLNYILTNLKTEDPNLKTEEIINNINENLKTLVYRKKFEIPENNGCDDLNIHENNEEKFYELMTEDILVTICEIINKKICSHKESNFFVDYLSPLTSTVTNGLLGVSPHKKSNLSYLINCFYLETIYTYLQKGLSIARKIPGYERDDKIRVKIAEMRRAIAEMRSDTNQKKNNLLSLAYPPDTIENIINNFESLANWPPTGQTPPAPTALEEEYNKCKKSLREMEERVRVANSANTFLTKDL